ncbi:natural resistance-associated macrophage protein-domain-containing protein [Phycomyces blakesleeanus]|uniref:Natural resistance-associated macrophage protein-domain-containing protein n=1 Tax=Phycomyces blakesleeanus TaxID=4837 RepID=A0ABR3AJ69_PHYBL
MSSILFKVSSYLRVLGKYIGPGFMIAVGYLDPGNWATDMQGGSEYGYRLLFIILMSNLVAIFLQNLTIRLGTVSGYDLASASRRFFPKWINLILYVLAEIGIIATDIAEVIGSAIALNLLFPKLPLPAGVAITAADVLLVLMFYNEEPESEGSQTESSSARLVRYFEIFVMLLVLAVGVCFVIELAYSDIVAVDLFKGFLPSKEIFTDAGCLYSAIGIIGATVMPHNLYLHSFITQGRCQEWRSRRPRVIKEGEEGWVVKPNIRSVCTDGDVNYLNATPKGDIKPLVVDPDTISISLERDTSQKVDVPYLARYIESNMKNNLHYGLVDLVFALCFAFFVNCAILIVASSNFFYGPNTQRQSVQDLFSAHDLLNTYLGPPAAIVFALALLCAGQSSTLTATLAGQVIMSGFLGMSSRPWVRRILTRLVAIVPAMVAACVTGREGLSTMLVGSQVALSIQLPFAVVPLIIFTSMERCMKLDLVVEHKDLQPRPYQEKSRFDKAVALWRSQIFQIFNPTRFSKKVLNSLDNMRNSSASKQETQSMNSALPFESVVLSTEKSVAPKLKLDKWPKPIIVKNGLITKIVAIILSTILIGLNIYMVVALGLGI